MKRHYGPISTPEKNELKELISKAGGE